MMFYTLDLGKVYRNLEYLVHNIFKVIYHIWSKDFCSKFEFTPIIGEIKISNFLVELVTAASGFETAYRFKTPNVTPRSD